LKNKVPNNDVVDPGASQITPAMSDRKKMSKSQKFIFISFSILCIAAIIACIIVNYAIDRKITWSIYPILSIPFGWLLFMPLIIKKHGLLLSLCSLTLITLPYLFLLEKITPVRHWFLPLGIPSAIAGVITIWVLYLLYRFLKINLWYKIAVTVFLSGVITSPIIDYYVDTFLYEEPRWLDSIINIASCIIVSVALFLLGRKRSKAKNAPVQETN